MADDRADPLRDDDVEDHLIRDDEAEDHIIGIINGEIPYVPDEDGQEEDVVSSFLNLDGDQEVEGTDIVDGGQPSTNDDLELQVATTSGEVYIYIEPLVIQTY